MTTPPPPPTSAPHIQLKPFGGTPKENWNQFESLFRASLAVARIPTADSQQCRYLHLHLWGTALSFYLGLTQAQQDDLEQSLRCLRNRYAGADKRRNFEFELNNRKFDPAKEDADDFLTDLQRLAELSIVDVPASTGVAAIDRSDERTRKVREQFIQGMPFKYKKALLKEDEDSNVTDLCKIIKRRLRADKLQPEVEPLTAFNEIEISQNSTSDLMNAIAQIEAKQDQLQQQFVQQNQQNYDSQNYDQSQHFWNPQNNYPRQTRGNSNYNTRGAYRGRGYTRGGIQNQSRNRSQTPGRIICRQCGKAGHMQKDCWHRQPPNRGANLPFRQSKN